MAAATKFQQFAEDLGKKVHNLAADQLTVALCNTEPDAEADAVLADLPTEATYTNLSSRDVTTTSFEQTAGVAMLILVDLVLTSTGGPTGPFRYVVLYNNTPTSPADPLIQYYDYASSVTLADGETFTVDFDGSAGVLTIT